MKKLKKLLAVVLAVCMSISLMATASAVYTDDSSIKYVTAVGTMTGIGVVDGKPGGSFDPAGIITRAEAAKIIAVALLGPTVIKSLPTIASNFSDVPTSYWAVPYIGYLTSKGIIGGCGDGTFNPDGNVTANQMAKMLLCAAGYGKKGEYTGTAWEFIAYGDAYTYNIFTNSTVTDFTKAATREEATLYVFNALMNIDLVSYSKTSDAYTKTGTTIAKTVFSMAAPTIGVITANASIGITGTKISQATLTAGKITALNKTQTTYSNYTTAMTDIGKVVNVYSNSLTGAAYYIQTLSKTVTVASKITTAAAYKSAFGTVDAAAKVVNATTNYAAVTVNDTSIAGGFNGSTKAAAGTYQLYAGEIVSYIAVSEASIQKVAFINNTAGSETITFSSTGALANNTATDVVNAYAGITVGDYVQINIVGSIYNVVKLGSVQGLITEIGASNSYFVLNGTKYLVSSVTDTTALGFASLTSGSDYAKTYILYLDASGYVFGFTLLNAVSSSAVVYVNHTPYNLTGDYGAVTKNYQCVDSTGTEVIYNTGTAADATVVGSGFYKVTVTAGIANFTAYTSADLVIPSIDSVITTGDVINGTQHYYASDVKFIFITGSGTALKVVKVTGLAAANGNTLAGAVLFFDNSTNTNKTVNTVIIPAAYVDPSVIGTNLVYIPNQTVPTGVNAGGSIYIVYVDGVKTTISATNASVAAFDDGFAAFTISGGIYTFTGVNSASNLHYNAAVAHNGVFGSYINGLSAGGAVVVDTFTDSSTGTPVTSVSAMAALTAAKKFTIDYVTNTSNAIIFIYITNIV
jgi:hypothetical protein